MLCFNCQTWFKDKSISTESAKSLFLALKIRDLPVQLEKFDGKKTIDIAIPKYRMNIEVDGTHHNTSASQARSDLFRTYYSFKKEFNTLRVPNSLISENLDLTADILKEMIEFNFKRIQREKENLELVSELTELKHLFLRFMQSFETVFSEDWVYTIEIIKEMSVHDDLMSLSIDNSNWNNRDQMMKLYRKLAEKCKEDLHRMWQDDIGEIKTN
jgi:very-short-patch-repair endonuclease